MYTGQILEKLEKNEPRNIEETKFTKTQKSKETHWKQKVTSVYTYKLNDNSSDSSKTVPDTDLIGVKLPSFK